MSDLQAFIDDMGESIQHMNVGKRDREIVKAGLRAAITYALKKRDGFSLKSPACPEQIGR